ncbi:acylphosphatase-1 isoform X1 [Hydra vulgaris]|uniref:acylphosphatase n=1 Tax=Hydra vulgaris TaxID=6087 RepID=A0ABM4C2B1_HYDVU
MASPGNNITVFFEVFGKVQNVFFRKYTQKNARILGLTGWVMNTKENTVVGVIQGNDENVNKMKQWLTNEGSPKSKIEKCVFREEIASSFNTFEIRK